MSSAHLQAAHGGLAVGGRLYAAAAAPAEAVRRAAADAALGIARLPALRQLLRFCSECRVTHGKVRNGVAVREPTKQAPDPCRLLASLTFEASSRGEARQ